MDGIDNVELDGTTKSVALPPGLASRLLSRGWSESEGKLTYYKDGVSWEIERKDAGVVGAANAQRVWLTARQGGAIQQSYGYRAQARKLPERILARVTGEYIDGTVVAALVGAKKFKAAAEAVISGLEAAALDIARPISEAGFHKNKPEGPLFGARSTMLQDRMVLINGSRGVANLAGVFALTIWRQCYIDKVPLADALQQRSEFEKLAARIRGESLAQAIAPSPARRKLRPQADADELERVLESGHKSAVELLDRLTSNLGWHEEDGSLYVARVDGGQIQLRISLSCYRVEAVRESGDAAFNMTSAIIHRGGDGVTRLVRAVHDAEMSLKGAAPECIIPQPRRVGSVFAMAM